MSPKPKTNHGKDLQRYLYLLGISAILFMVGSYWYVEYFTRKDIGSETLVHQTGVRSHRVPNPTSNTPGLSPFSAPSLVETPQFQQVAVQTNGNTFASVVQSMMPSVVNVSASSANPAPAPADPAAPAQNRQPGMGFASPYSGIAQESIGSGVIVTKDGYILTNYHVIEQAQHVSVTVFNSMGTKHYHADIVGRDEARDLALLKIVPVRALQPAALGNSEPTQVGDPVIAIGSPFGLDQTVSKGIVSGKKKTVNIGGTIHKGLLQTDAAINRGNSGGPLVDQAGYVIGINTAIYTTTSAFSGVGFAVPINSAKDFLEDFIPLPKVTPNLTGQPIAGTPVVAGGAAAPPISADAIMPHGDRGPCESCHEILPSPQGQPIAFAMGPNNRHMPGMQNNRRHIGRGNQFAFAPSGAIGLPTAMTTGDSTGLGAEFQPLDPANRERLRSPVPAGVWVASVQPGSVADQADLRADDIIFKMNGRRVATLETFHSLIAGYNPGEKVRISVVRNGERQDLELVADWGVAPVANQQQPTHTFAGPPKLP
ncbi:MAG: trypsin-like peptidase domain-containing protein [Magnetococcales bacterium]|nr:trypsin-like peptidase domain-containing protein [Magnetococcales bacterium]